RRRPDLTDTPWANVATHGLGFYQFTDLQQGGLYFAWSKDVLPHTRYVWTLGFATATQYPMYGVQGWDAPEGAGWRDFYGHFCGLPGGDYFVGRAEDSVYAGNPMLLRRGERKVGDRFEPHGGYVDVASGIRYIGRMCTTAGW